VPDHVPREAAPAELSRLRWRCRRGMRELDVLLTSWLGAAYATAGDERRQAFQQLLEREDDEIWDWMMGRANPPEQLVDIVDLIGHHHADRRQDG